MSSKCRYCFAEIPSDWQPEIVERTPAEILASEDLWDPLWAHCVAIEALDEVHHGPQHKWPKLLPPWSGWYKGRPWAEGDTLNARVRVDVAAYCSVEHRWADAPHRADNPRLRGVLDEWRETPAECEGQEALW